MLPSVLGLPFTVHAMSTVVTDQEAVVAPPPPRPLAALVVHRAPSGGRQPPARISQRRLTSSSHHRLHKLRHFFVLTALQIRSLDGWTNGARPRNSSSARHGRCFTYLVPARFHLRRQVLEILPTPLPALSDITT